MNQKVAAVRAEQWRQTVYNCLSRDPKISKRQWCKENGIKIRSLMYWQKKFQLEALDRMDNCKVALPVQIGSNSAPAFADMSAQLEALQTERVSLPPEQETMPLAPELMIQAGSYRIYVNGSIQQATLETVMRVISHA